METEREREKEQKRQQSDAMGTRKGNERSDATCRVNELIVVTVCNNTMRFVALLLISMRLFAGIWYRGLYSTISMMNSVISDH